MDEGEKVWEKKGGIFGRLPWAPFPKGVTAALVAIALAAISIPSFTSSNKPRPVPSATPTQSTPVVTSASPSPSVQEVQGPPIGILVYPTAQGVQADTIDDHGVRRACFRGSKAVSIQQVIAGRIYFTDGDLYRTSMRCEAPRRVLSRRQLLGRKPAGDDQIQCVSLSPDRTKIAFDLQSANSGLARPWVAASDGKNPRPRPGLMNCVNPIGWADNSHYLIQPYSDVLPVAADVSRGTVFFLRNAEMWQGALSPDGGMAVYSVATGGAVNDIFLLDRRTGLKKRLDLSRDEFAPELFNQFSWNPSSSRFMLAGPGVPYIVFSRAGIPSTPANPPVVGTDEPRPEWFDDTHVWMTVGSRIVVWDVETGTITIDFTLENLNTSTGGPSLFLETNNPGILQHEPSLQKDPDPEILVARGIYARTAPGWRGLPCRGCRSGPYSFGAQLAQPTTMGNPCSAGDGFLFGWTGDSVSRVRSQLLHAWGADRPGHSDPQSSDFVDVAEKTLQIDGRQFVFLQASFYECAEWVAFARVGTRTIMINVPSDGLDLPANKVVIDTLRFTG